MAKKGLSPLLSVYPLRGMVDDRLDIHVQCLLPGLQVTLHALIHSEDGDFWEAFGYYVSDASGFVHVSKDACLGGSYHDVEPMGLLWSMRPIPGSRTGLRFRSTHSLVILYMRLITILLFYLEFVFKLFYERFRKNDPHTPIEVHISVYDGHLHDGFREKSPLASVVVQRWYIAPGVEKVDVREKGLKGTLFIPPGHGPFPAVLDLWGGGGGLVEYRSALLASRGFVSLALEYIGLMDADGKPRNVGNDYFEAAFTVLKQHPRVCPDRVAMMGLSFGVSVTLGMAAYSSVIKPRCVVCISGSHIIPVNGSLSDVFDEIKKNVKNTRYDEEQRIIWRDLLLPIPKDPLKKVDMGRITCPVLLIVGEDDQNWPASESVEDIKEMMERAGNSHLLTILSYPGAGHLIEPPYSPHIRASNFMLREAKKKVVVLWGGQTKPHCKAQEDSWHKTLAFLEQHLYSSTTVACRARQAGSLTEQTSGNIISSSDFS